MKFTRKSIAHTIEALLESGARKAVTFLDEQHVVTATRRHKPDGRARTTEIMLTLGKPNSRARDFIRACKKSGEPFPVKKVQLKFWS